MVGWLAAQQAAQARPATPPAFDDLTACTAAAAVEVATAAAGRAGEEDGEGTELAAGASKAAAQGEEAGMEPGALEWIQQLEEQAAGAEQEW